jgi:hypothetical protein
MSCCNLIDAPEREEARQAILAKDPDAFKSKVEEFGEVL